MGTFEITDKDYPNPPQDEQRSDYHRETMAEGIAKWESAGLDPHGDGCGEPADPDLREQLLAGGPVWDMDCTEYLIPHGDPAIDQKLRYNLEKAIDFLMYTRQEMTNKDVYPDTKSVLMAGNQLAEFCQNIGMIILDNFIKETEGK